MSRAISRDSFNELKQYIGVHLQQGRVILDSDWNEGQDIMANLARRLGQDAFGDGVLGEGFEIQPVIPSPWKPNSLNLFELSYFQGHLPVSMRFPPTEPFDNFESMDGWAIQSGTGKLRISRDQPYEGRGFLRLSDHTGEVTIAKTLSSPTDLSASQYGHFRFRLNHDANVPSGAARFFVEDADGNRNLWPLTAPWAAKDRWFMGAALPLDLRFHLFDIDLLPAMVGQSYVSALPTFPTPSTINSGVTFSFVGDRPSWLNVGQSSGHSTPYYGLLTGIPSAPGKFTVTVKATTGATTAVRTFQLKVLDNPQLTQLHTELMDLSGTTGRALDFWKTIHARPTTRNGTPANLSSIKRYGFIITPAGAAPSIWDFDALHFSSGSLIREKAANNFVIGGPTGLQQTDTLLQTLQTNDATEDASEAVLLLAMKSRNTPRAFVSGYGCSQPREILYTDQQDLRDPAITMPEAGDVRKDLVYLDVTREPVTYIEDPGLREIALGGPDTSTRMQIRQRVRVAVGGSLPTDGGVGRGTLATEGSYTDRTNRLYRVEIDTTGNIGQATVRWSDDNASTLQRVIETVSSRSTKLRVEDASAFRAGDLILLCKEFIQEEHRITSVNGNTILLQEATNENTTFALDDRPWIQRWNAFRVPIMADPNDSTVSAPISLSFGVALRFGGRALKAGDFWTFRARYLAGDAASGIDPTSRIEPLDFQLPQGVVHQYLPLALLLRDPAANLPGQIQLIRDLRPRAGHIVVHALRFEHTIQGIPISLSGTEVAQPKLSGKLGELSLGLTSTESQFLYAWTVSIDGNQSEDLEFLVNLYNNEATNPGVNDVGKVTTSTLTITTSSPKASVAAIATHDVTTDSPVPSSELVVAHVTARRTSFVNSCTVKGTLQIIEFKPPALSP